LKYHRTLLLKLIVLGLVRKIMDPTEAINYNSSIEELEHFLIFSICVANKGAYRTGEVISRLLKREGGSPFDKIRLLIKQGQLDKSLREVRTGQYNRIGRALKEIVESGLNLRTCSVEDLLKIHGIGNKTARFFILFTRPNQRLASLDTHILKFLRDKGYDVPKSTPQSNKKYKEVEELFLKEADKAGRDPAEFDLEIWKSYTRK